MKKIISLGVLAVFLMVGLNSCGKYEEGPGISLRSKTKRIEGEWKIDRVTQDDIDVTNAFPAVVQNFGDDGVYTATHNGQPYVGVWELDSDKENILITMTGSSDQEKYKIIRLKNDDMWLDNVVGAQTVRYYLVPN